MGEQLDAQDRVRARRLDVEAVGSGRALLPAEQRARAEGLFASFDAAIALGDDSDRSIEVLDEIKVMVGEELLTRVMQQQAQC